MIGGIEIMDGGICFTQNVDPVHASINEIMDWVHSFGPRFSSC